MMSSTLLILVTSGLLTAMPQPQATAFANQDDTSLEEFAASLYGYWDACFEMYPKAMAKYSAWRARLEGSSVQVARLRRESRDFAERRRIFKSLVLASGSDKPTLGGCQAAARWHFVPAPDGDGTSRPDGSTE